jgi:hypothetical protein
MPNPLNIRGVTDKTTQYTRFPTEIRTDHIQNTRIER